MITTRDLDDARASLTKWLTAKLPSDADVEVAPLVPVAVGESNETLYLDATWTEDGVRAPHGLVVRARPEASLLFVGRDVLFQWQMMEAVAAHSDVPVPALHWKEDDSAVLGTPFFVMGRVEGDVPGQYSSELFVESTPDERRRIFVNTLAAMAEIHRIDWRDGFTFLDTSGPGAPGLDRYLSWMDGWYEWAAAGREFPAIEQALRYLRDRRPSDASTGVIWGDSRPGNVIFASDRSVAAVVDWELAALAPPESDLAWMLMFEQVFGPGSRQERPAGVPGRDELISIYEGFRGRPVGDMRYYDVLAWARFRITFIRHIDVLVPGADNEAIMRGFCVYVEQSLEEVLAAAGA
jgi:aminoglycoside phosphotransferase (APT) family kinase protein